MKKKKVIIHLLRTNKLSGAEKVVINIINMFKDEYDMYYCSPKGPIEEDLKKNNINYLPLNKFSLYEFKKVIKDIKPDIIQAHDYRASILSSFIPKVKIISMIHQVPEYSEKWNLKTILYTLRIHRFDKIIGVSDSVYEKAIYKKFIKNKYKTIYNYVDKDEIIKKSNEYKSKEHYDIFFLGRITRQKNPIMFVDIIKEIKKENKNIKAVMLGGGDKYEEVKNYIKENNLEKNIIMKGFTPNPFPIIKNSKVGILPSYFEGLGLAAIEAIILDKPFLNSGCSGMIEVFTNNPQLICHTIDEYVNKYKNIDKIKFNKKDLDKFIHKDKYKKEINNLYK